ncbi:MAG: serine/threonine protein kinase [Ignavibacteria bacterium]|nr:MAG: serine/threonine protein kinase [Ignavibacteria bacterium]KAF0162066.1 MAG: serine/threonine protein kinase [Ignavibacteria bacterium]
MKKQSKNIWKPVVSALILASGVLFIFDLIIMPIYVSGSEIKIPNVIGIDKEKAFELINDAGLTPIIQTTRYDEKYGKDKIIFQKPEANKLVKGGRRVYITVSGGEQLVRVPFIVNKTIRDAQVTLERAGLFLGEIDSVESETDPNIIVEQQYFQGRELAKGSNVNVKISIGPQQGMVRVPDLIGRSFSEAENILKQLQIRIGTQTFFRSSTYLPNTVINHFPPEGTLINIGDSVNVDLVGSKTGVR